MNSFKNDVRNTPGGGNVLNCFLCGSCSAGCPVSGVDDSYDPRKIMRMILLDMEEEVLKPDEIWKCNQCHCCVAHCPQDVRFADIVRALRDMAVEKGYREKGLPEKVLKIDDELRRERLLRIKGVLT